MSSSRIISRFIGCQDCHIRVLRSFLRLTNATITETRSGSLGGYSISRISRAYRRPYSMKTAVDGDGSGYQPDHGQKILQPPVSTEKANLESRSQGLYYTSKPTATEDTDVPWYLQDQKEDVSHSSYLKRELPNLPMNSPTRLRPVMEHLFTDIGLNDLRVLDLRAMDPPPALGSNLIMVLGTARSEKHLHASADRFCRWLRASYRLQPVADGLLGRNELKIKLRRKARRMRLLGSRGIPQEDDNDDGIQTGWVCVNVGQIEKVTNTRQVELDAADIVGFSDFQDGTHLVVQMMTADKREDLDLEKLWLDALAARTARSPRLKVSSGSEEVGNTDKILRPDADMTLNSFSHRNQLSSRSQHRRLHTSRFLDLGQHDTFREAKENWESLERYGISDRLESFWQITRPRLAEPYESSLSTLEALSESSAIESLGHGPYDKQSTPFLRRLFSSPNGETVADYWACRTWICLYGMLIGHPAFSPAFVQEFFSYMEMNIIFPGKHIYEAALQAFVPISRKDMSILHEHPKYDRSTLIFVLGILGRLRNIDSHFELGYILERLYLAELQYLLSTATTNGMLDGCQITYRLAELHKTTGSYGAYELSEAFHANALLLMAKISPDMQLFLDHWATIPIYSNSRTSLHYTVFFKCLAESGNARVIDKVLEENVEMMQLELPSVALKGEIATGILACLQLLEPAIKNPDEDSHRLAQRWAAIRHQCLHQT